jgi:hypothetical protein
LSAPLVAATVIRDLEEFERGRWRGFPLLGGCGFSTLSKLIVELLLWFLSNVLGCEGLEGEVDVSVALV